MILRFRSPDGAYRVTVEPSENLDSVRQKLIQQIPKNVVHGSLALSDVPNGMGKRTFDDLAGITIADAQFKHGDLLFLFYDKSEQTSTPTAPKSSAPVRLNGGAVAPQDRDSSFGRKNVIQKEDMVPTTSLSSIKQDPIDNLLEKQDGKISRPRDAAMCKHGPKGMCDYCMPLEPYDPKYLAEKKIKHLSFHSYLRQLNSATNKAENASSFIAPLSEPYYRVRQPCPSGHPSWPAGICSKCQPSAITLKPQSFRLVDHVEFSDPQLINHFIEFWRQTGSQRIGYLYGRYEPYTEVPLGIKAVVEAIYEPPQAGESDGVSLTLPWEQDKEVDYVASLCGLSKVGVIFTDLLDAGKGDGSVICKRHIDSYFLSSLEICFAAQLQAENPNPSKWSDSGKFGSKFVTCVVSGNDEGGIDVASYQVSLSAVEMVKADIIEPAYDPGLMLVKEEDEKSRYIPEVFYRKINKYGASVQENAKPAFPVEYLLVTLTHGFPQTPVPMFTSTKQFPVENRERMGVVQDLKALSKHLGLTGKDEDLGVVAISDFHLLNYVHAVGILDKPDEALLARVATTHDLHVGMQLLESPGWQTLLAIIRESGEAPSPSHFLPPPLPTPAGGHTSTLKRARSDASTPSDAEAEDAEVIVLNDAEKARKNWELARKRHRAEVVPSAAAGGGREGLLIPGAVPAPSLSGAQALLAFENWKVAKRLGGVSLNREMK